MTPVRHVIGIGNGDRGDDGAGLVVAQRLRASADDGIRVIEHCGEATGLVELLKEARCAWLIDAASSGARTGTIHRFDVSKGPLPHIGLKTSTHGLGLAEAIELARAMDWLPERCIVFAIEGSGFEAGQVMSKAVRAAAGKTAELILAEL